MFGFEKEKVDKIQQNPRPHAEHRARKHTTKQRGSSIC